MNEKGRRTEAGPAAFLLAGARSGHGDGVDLHPQALVGQGRDLQFLADPNIAFLLLSLGTLGIIYELATPGVGIAGVAGATMLLLALFAIRYLVDQVVIGIVLNLFGIVLVSLVALTLAPLVLH